MFCWTEGLKGCLLWLFQRLLNDIMLTLMLTCSKNRQNKKCRLPFVVPEGDFAS